MATPSFSTITRARAIVVTEKSADADEVLLRSSQVEKIDSVARRTFELNSPALGVEVVLGRELTKHAAQLFPQRLTTREVADFFGVSLRTILKLAP